MRELARRGFQRLSNHPRQCICLNRSSKPNPGHRHIAIQATPSTDTSAILVDSASSSISTPDATFEVLGSPSSLLSVSLSPSQAIHTRRGTLVGVSTSSPDSTISTLRLLSPFSRAISGIPFLYQRITSTTPLSLLISSKSPLTTFCVLHLDGTIDWRLSQRKSLLAYTGTTLSIRPTGLAPTSISQFWGTSTATGRGLLALVGHGNIYSLQLSAGESYIAHPSHILAYTLPGFPKPYRFKSTPLKLQIPTLNFFPSSKFVQNIKDSPTYRTFAGILHRIRTWSRRTIWGDRLFLRFEGPTTLLLQSRGARLNDVLTAREVDEIADSPPGAVEDTIRGRSIKSDSDASRTGFEGATVSAAPAAGAPRKKPKLSYASVSRDGKVKIEET